MPEKALKTWKRRERRGRNLIILLTTRKIVKKKQKQGYLNDYILYKYGKNLLFRYQIMIIDLVTHAPTARKYVALINSLSRAMGLHFAFERDTQKF